MALHGCVARIGIGGGSEKLTVAGVAYLSMLCIYTYLYIFIYLNLVNLRKEDTKAFVLTKSNPPSSPEIKASDSPHQGDPHARTDPFV